MAVTVKLRYLRHSAKKLRPYTRMFAGKNLESAINKTMIMPQDSARYIHKALLMARAAAELKEFDRDTLVITEIMANEGPRIKRSRANARGRSNRYIKHLAHLVISVGETAGTAKAKSATKTEKKIVEQPKLEKTESAEVKTTEKPKASKKAPAKAVKKPAAKKTTKKETK
jgi:large subunit ribosomal protein L22